MEANELRLGNLVYFPNISKEATVNLAIIQSVFYGTERYEPIPLTEEWVLKFGFQKEWSRFEIQEEIFAFVLGDIYLHFIDGECWFCDEYDGNLSKGRKLKGIHDLQNLFFALKGKELTLKKN